MHFNTSKNVNQEQKSVKAFFRISRGQDNRLQGSQSILMGIAKIRDSSILDNFAQTFSLWNG